MTLPAPRRSVYKHDALDRLFNPKSIAIYGISPNPASFGAKTVANLAPWDGHLLLINPKYDTIGTRPCHPSIAALPEKPDCVIITLPMEAVDAAATECAASGARSAIVFASGYAEMSEPARIAAQQRLSAIARESGMRISGPNCMGYLNGPRHLLASFSAAEMKPDAFEHPGIGIASQSGALGYGFAQAAHRGAQISHVLTTGNGCDVNIADEIAWLAEERSCKTIVCIFEGLEDPEHLAQAGDIAWKAGKPVIVHKLGTSTQGARAAISHTGSPAGSIEDYRRICERAGMVMVEDMEGVMEAASFFAKAPRRPSALGVAVLSPSGGLGVASADAAEKHGVPLPQPPEDVKKKLEALIPDFGSRRNPADVTAAVAGDLARTTQCFDAMAGDATYGALVFPQVLYSNRTTDRDRMFSEIAERHGKPILLPMVGGWIGGPGYVEAERNPHTTPFLSVDRCFATLAAWFRLEERRAAEEQSTQDK